MFKFLFLVGVILFISGVALALIADDKPAGKKRDWAKGSGYTAGIIGFTMICVGLLFLTD